MADERKAESARCGRHETRQKCQEAAKGQELTGHETRNTVLEVGRSKLQGGAVSPFISQHKKRQSEDRNKCWQRHGRIRMARRGHVVLSFYTVHLSNSVWSSSS